MDDEGGDDAGMDTVAQALEAKLAKHFAGADDADEGDDADGDDGALDASGDNETHDQEDQEASGQDDRSDDPEDDGAQPDPKQGERLSRIVQKLTKRERELSEARKRIKELEEQAQRPAPKRSKADLADRVEFVRAAIADALGVDPTDERVAAELSEASIDLATEMLADGAEGDPQFKERRERRREAAKQAAKERELQKRIDEIERHRLEAERERIKAQAEAERTRTVGFIGEHVRSIADSVPFLLAQDEGDPAEMVLEVVDGWRKRGEIDPRTREEALAAVESAAKRLDDVYRQKAGRYAKLLGGSEGKAGKLEPKPKKKQGWTATDKTASGKNKVTVAARDEDEERPDVLEALRRKFQ